MAIKVAFIGAGSVGFTRGLFRDILTVPEFADTQFAFTDINKKNLDMVAQLCEKDLRTNHLKGASIETTLDRRRAVADADYVISCVRVGGLEAFATDIDIPLKYGIDQCVGDTLCAGGIMYGQRNVSCVLDFCRDMREVSKDGVLFLNYANPNVMNTWAAIEYGGIDTIGLCHGVEGGHWQIVEVIKLLINGDKKPGDRGYREITRSDVDIICAGINHQTWYVKVLFDGQDWTGRLLEGFEKHPAFSTQEPVRIDMLRRFGYYSTESNGHLSEYVPWYRKRKDLVKKWRGRPDPWINGETGGYLRVCTEGRRWFETDFPTWLKAEDKPLTPENRGGEHGSYIIEGLETGRVYRGHFNVRNNGCISNLPNDCIVEVPGYVDRNGVSIPIVGDLPLACAATLSMSVNVQRMAVKAAVEGDLMLLKQAMLHDPLTAAVCDPEDVWQMVDEMIIAQAPWLPQFREYVPAAKKRLEAARKAGDYRGKHGTTGACREKTKSVAEMKKQAAKTRAQAAATDKAQAAREKAVKDAKK